MTEKNLYDAVVVGGGPGGATTATVLAQHDRRVLLLERDTFPSLSCTALTDRPPRNA